MLSDEDRKSIWADFMSEAGARRNVIDGLLKQDLREAVDAIDAWIESSIPDFNSAIPQPARSNLTSRQKLEIFLAIIKHRWEVS